MKIAVLDLGTNTFHLLITKVYPDSTFDVLMKTRGLVKLGKGGISKNRIADIPFKKGVKTIIHFNRYIQKFKVDKVFAYATSAIRSAENGIDFTKKVKNETGIDIEIISGNQEAELIYYGVRQCVKLEWSPVLIMDIGGGSTEFIIANQSKIFWKQSFNIGASRLLEQFQPSDPIQRKEIVSLQKYLDQVLSPLHLAIQKFPVSLLVGSSGSFDTLAEMIAYRFYGRNILRLTNSYRFNLGQYKQVHEWLLKSTLRRRIKTKGLIKMRVDMIVLSSICTNYILKKYRIKEMHLSKYALKEGALWKIIYP